MQIPAKIGPYRSFLLARPSGGPSNKKFGRNPVSKLVWGAPITSHFWTDFTRTPRFSPVLPVSLIHLWLGLVLPSSPQFSPVLPGSSVRL